MIVLDEQMQDPRIFAAIERWYPGQVISITQARRSTRILDDVVPALLHGLKEPTFVTANYKDFWLKIEAHPGYCVICIELPVERLREASSILRNLLKSAEWKTKRKRMGKVISISGKTIRYYQVKSRNE